MRAMVVLVMLWCVGCSEPPPYEGPLWGDPCQTDKGEDTISGCTHPSDGTGDASWGSESEVGICAPPSASTLATVAGNLRAIGYTGACRPLCERFNDAWTCPAVGVPTYEMHGLESGLGLCYCSDTHVDAPGALAN